MDEDHFDGLLSRWLSRARGYWVERFDLELRPEVTVPQAAIEDEVLLDHCAVTNTAKLGPSIIYQRVVPISRDEKSRAQFFGGNLSAEPDDSILLDASDIPSMPDEEFWELIAELREPGFQDHVDVLTDTLAALGTTTTLGFYNALTDKLFRLDTVINPWEWSSDVEPEEASLWYRCWVVAQGKATYDAAVNGDHVVRWDRNVEEAFELLEVGPLAIAKIEHTLPPTIVSRSPYWTGATAIQPPPRARPVPRAPSPAVTATDDERLERYYATYEGALYTRYGRDRVWDLAAISNTSWSVARALLDDGETLREVLAWFSHPRMQPVKEQKESIFAYLRATTIGTPDPRYFEICRIRWARPHGQVIGIFEIKRRSKLSAEDYQKRYFPSPNP